MFFFLKTDAAVAAPTPLLPPPLPSPGPPAMSLPALLLLLDCSPVSALVTPSAKLVDGIFSAFAAASVRSASTAAALARSSALAETTGAQQAATQRYHVAHIVFRRRGLIRSCICRTSAECCSAPAFANTTLRCSLTSRPPHETCALAPQALAHTDPAYNCSTMSEVLRPLREASRPQFCGELHHREQVARPSR